MTKKAPAQQPARGRLKSMRVSSGFREYVLDQLAAVPGLRDRSMFGGIGLYADDLFFGILASDVLYFKVDDSNRQEYEQAGSRPFKPYADRAMTMPYYAVPIEIVDDGATLVKWAKRAVGVAAASNTPQRNDPQRSDRRAILTSPWSVHHPYRLLYHPETHDTSNERLLRRGRSSVRIIFRLFDSRRPCSEQ
jgi:DNA transformation protein